MFVSDVVRGQWNLGEVDRIILHTAMRDGRGVTVREEMEPGSAGKAVCVARAAVCGAGGSRERGRAPRRVDRTRWAPLRAPPSPNTAGDKFWLEARTGPRVVSDHPVGAAIVQVDPHR